MAQVISLTPLCADLGRSLALRGQKLLLEENLAEIVPELAPLTLYLTIKEMGLDEGAPLLLAASAEQRQAIVDLECWPDDDFDGAELDAWLTPFAQAGPSELAAAFLSLDAEVQVLFFQQSLRIIDHRALGDEHDDRGDVEEAALADLPEGRNHVKTPDGQFTLFDLSEEREVPPFALLDALFAEPEGIREAYRLLTAARTEMASPLAEEAHYFRTARLSDLGFCSPEEGARLFARPPKAAPQKGRPSKFQARAVLPATMALVLRDTTPLFCQALDAIEDPEQLLALEHEWLNLVNAAIVGYRARYTDVAAISETASMVRDALSLALEVELEKRAGQTASELLVELPLVYLFQCAIAAIRPLSDQARAASKTPAFEAWLGVSPTPEAGTPEGLARLFFHALASPRPLWQGESPHAPRKRAFWRTLEDVERSQVTLNELIDRVERGHVR